MKICIYSGTFNPVHNAHVKVIERILEEFNFDKIIIIPNNTPPHKNSETVATAEDRFNMLRLAFEDKRIEVSDVEIKRGGKSYSYDTVQEIKKKYNIEGKINFLIGTDAILGIKNWYEYEKLIKEIDFIVVKRQDEINIEHLIKSLNLPDLTYEISKVPFLDISSSQVRKIFREKNNPENILPDKVLEYILKQKIYQNYDFDNIIKILETEFNVDMEHSIAVAKMAANLAKKYQLNEYDAYLAGLLHDCVKYIKSEEIQNLIKENNIEIFEHEMQAPKTLHAPLGAYIAEYRFGVKDKIILDAIRFHTIGRCEMSLFEKIIFISDKIEPVTREPEFRVKIEPYLTKGIDKAIFAYFELLIEKLNSENVLINFYTRKVYEYFENIKKGDE